MFNWYEDAIAENTETVAIISLIRTFSRLTVDWVLIFKKALLSCTREFVIERDDFTVVIEKSLTVYIALEISSETLDNYWKN